jgi:hypothetical protein
VLLDLGKDLVTELLLLLFNELSQLRIGFFNIGIKTLAVRTFMSDNFLGCLNGLLRLGQSSHQMFNHLVLFLRRGCLSGEGIQLFLNSSEVRIVLLLLLVHGFL